MSMGIGESLERVDSWLKGWPDTFLTAALLTVAAVLVFLALTETAAGKAVVLAWVVLP